MKKLMNQTLMRSSSVLRNKAIPSTQIISQYTYTSNSIFLNKGSSSINSNKFYLVREHTPKLWPILNKHAFFSTTSAAAAETENTEPKSKKKESESSNIFLDNIGKIFLAIIISIILFLVRSSRNMTLKSRKRDEIEEQSLLDPCEVDDLRSANEFLTPQVFESILDQVLLQFQTRDLTTEVKYANFLSVVIHTMRQLKGEQFTIELGYLIDRLVLAKLRQKNSSQELKEKEKELVLPLNYLLTVITMALNSSVNERIDILYKILLLSSSSLPYDDSLCQLLQHLQESNQLDTDAQVIEILEEKYPFQQYQQACPKEMIHLARNELQEKFGLSSDEARGTLVEFDALLKSQYICAWGECYGRRSVRDIVQN